MINKFISQQLSVETNRGSRTESYIATVSHTHFVFIELTCASWCAVRSAAPTIFKKSIESKFSNAKTSTSYTDLLITLNYE